MADVLIRGMKMPQECDQCPFFDDRYDYPTCGVTQRSHGYNWNPRGQRMPDCPLIEVPPHGRLIDADAMRKQARENLDFVPFWMMDEAPTVIEASEVENV